MKKVALIPARGGSKRIPNKNIKDFCGKPIIAYPLQIALESGLFDSVVVSTDSHQIAQVAKEYGASVPFMRPDKLSDDFTPTSLVAAHGVQMLELEQDDLLCVIYPTAALLSAASLENSLHKLLQDSNKLFCFGAVAYEYNPHRSFYVRGNTIEMPFPQHYLSRSQDLEQLFHDAGQFYWGRVSAWTLNLPIFAKHSDVLVLDPMQAQDIDTLQDWYITEMKYKMLHFKHF